MTSHVSPFLVSSDSPTTLGRTLQAYGKTHPVYWDDFWHCWVVLRYHDVIAAFRDTETFSNSVYRVGALASNPVSKDGESHAVARRPYGQLFSPKAVTGYADLVVAPIARRIVDAIAVRGSADLVEDFTMKFPVAVITELLGLPVDFVERTDTWVRALNAWFAMPLVAGVVTAGEQAYREMTAHVRSAVAEEMHRPRPNLLGNAILALREEGDVTFEQCEQLAINLIHAGYFSTTWMVTSVLSAFLLHPAALQRVRNDRTRLAPAIEEAMRWGTSMTGALRHVTRDVRVGEVELRAGSTVLLCTAAANYDEEVYPQPEIFDIAREPSHLLLGTGPHYCVGAPLARLQARVGISLLLDRLSDLRLDPSAPPTFMFNVRNTMMHGPDRLQILFSNEPQPRDAGSATQ